jgi:hypothetical protein
LEEWNMKLANDSGSMGSVRPSAAPISFQLLKWIRMISPKAMLAMAK